MSDIYSLSTVHFLGQGALNFY